MGGRLEERDVRVRMNGPPALRSSAHELFGAMVRVQVLRMGLELTGPQPSEDAPVDVLEHESCGPDPRARSIVPSGRAPVARPLASFDDLLE
jgi:hypothetical protein